MSIHLTDADIGKDLDQTPSAYSVEEHMFRQDEIDKRHPQQPADQQRSYAEQIYEYCMSCMGVVCWRHGKTDITAGIQRILNGEKP